MLEIQLIRNEKEAVLEGLKKRNIDASDTIEKILLVDQEWRRNKTELDTIASELNQIARNIGEFFKSGKQAEANHLKETTITLKEKETVLKNKVDELDAELTKLLYTLPNVPNVSVKQGREAAPVRHAGAATR